MKIVYDNDLVTLDPKPLQSLMILTDQGGRAKKDDDMDFITL